ncbi:amino acid ABC transporter substrate-binding protein [Roseateles sp. YR242]|uniref:amino acid ABC transporter substrate-binding protein n=1 Tax=Roseateles sp. YR242 TaxID=1855305 RepID=UPI0015A56B44|nr:amino acid ABC transporter substrate-binding protein [Roseateles sp. YR242]
MTALNALAALTSLAPLVSRAALGGMTLAFLAFLPLLPEAACAAPHVQSAKPAATRTGTSASTSASSTVAGTSASTSASTSSTATTGAPKAPPSVPPPAGPSTAPARPPEGPTLTRIRDTGVVVMGYRPASLPFSYLDAQLKPIGYTVELCERVIDTLRARLKLPDLEVRRVAVGSATRLPMVTNGTLDLECGITTNTAERARTQAFSITIFVAETRLMTRNGERVQSLTELRGRPVVSTIGTTSIQHLAAVNEQQQLGIRIVAGLDDPDAFQLLRSGRAEAFLMDDVLLRSLLAQQGGSVPAQDYVVSNRGLTVEPYAIGLNRDDPAFKALVDETITGLYRSGEIFSIYKRWFASSLPASGINLQMPMSAALRKVVAQPTDSPDPARYR